jgi:hypothetical protein
LGVLGISFGLAFLMNIAVESPIAHLDNFIFKKLMGKIIGEPQNAKEAEVSGIRLTRELLAARRTLYIAASSAYRVI